MKRRSLKPAADINSSNLHGLIVANFSVLYQPIPSAKNQPARIPPQPPPPRGQMQRQKSAEVLPNPFPQKIVLANPSPHFAPPHCPNTWRAEPQKEKCPFHFRKNQSRANPKSKEHFFF